MPVHSFNFLIFGKIFLACVNHKSDVSFNKLKAITHQVEVEETGNKGIFLFGLTVQMCRRTEEVETTVRLYIS